MPAPSAPRGWVAEEILGRALRGKRDQAVVATKVGMKIGPAEDDEGLSPAHVRRECDCSLRRPEPEADLLPLCREEGLSGFPYRVLEGGILAGKYRPGEPPPPGSRAAEQPLWVPLLAEEGIRARWTGLAAESAAEGKDLFSCVLRRTLAVPGIASLVLGMRHEGQLDAAVDALK
jgi:aryl-alcohol dehydrogenase-like predicted oxidoreductase